ncbi:hypothetical protein [Amniculibacterium aquaticum]|uniref:hypothetical protein n=1 Tax=Amniculibacterium aquaticum TaxID=2479858 RepID=UPI000F5B74A7|nr:hypothetical protein [Amniculibacterium aquaticum]
MIPIIIILLLLIIIPSILFFIFVKKFNGLKEVSIILGSLILLIFACVYFFQDSDSEIIVQKLTESNFKLNDKFKVFNKSEEQTLIDYYTDYEILISEKDKLNLINKIRNSKKFKKINQDDYSSYWKNEYEKELIDNQTVRNYNINQFYFRTITFPNSSRKLETKIDTIKNELRITDSAD